MTWQTLLPVAKRRCCRHWLPLLLLLRERTAAALHGTAETCVGWLSDGLESARVLGYAPIRSQPTRMLEIHYFYANNTSNNNSFTLTTDTNGHISTTWLPWIESTLIVFFVTASPITTGNARNTSCNISICCRPTTSCTTDPQQIEATEFERN